jgi:hypothetical protein
VASQLWCSRCGAEALLVGASLDPRHPLGRCQRQPRSCGQVPVIRDRDELVATLNANKVSRARVRHLAHLKGHLVRDCVECQVMLARAYGPVPGRG